MRAGILRLLAALVLLHAGAALAEASLLLSSSRVASQPRVALVGSAKSSTGLGLGAGGTFAWTDRRTFGGEALFWTGAGVFEARGGVAWQLWESGLFALSAQTGGVLYGVGRSALDVGLGPQLGMTLGLGRERWEVALGAQAGAELFVRTGGPRLPLRGLLQGRWGRGPVDFMLWTRGGADLESGTHPAVRLEAGVGVAWVSF